MTKVLIVDDSVVFRSQISNALAQVPGIEVAGTAANGKIAIQKLEQSTVDLMTLDMEMPEMDGLAVLREVKQKNINVRIIIFSSQTQKGAKVALEALREGADDVITKPSGDGLSFETAAEAIREILVPKIKQFTAAGYELLEKKAPFPRVATVSDSKNISPPKRELSGFKPSVIVIGSSTGGPMALEKIFEQVKGPIQIPILITQHMPPVFTEILAKHIESLSGIPTSEAKMGELIQANHIYIAPGNFHLLVDGTQGQPRIVLNQAPQRNFVRPAVDYLFETTANIFKKGCLGVVLTGMGEDGLCGARVIRENGGAVLIQNRESCVVFGMPGAIYESNDYDQISDLSEIAHLIKRASGSIS